MVAYREITMAIHRLVASQLIPRLLDEVFPFFADPNNLGRLTPPGLGFEFLTSDRSMRSGLRIDYRLRPLARVPVHWQTLIDAYEPPHGFHDIQAKGPYRSWAHRHTFEAVDGGTVGRS